MDRACSALTDNLVVVVRPAPADSYISAGEASWSSTAGAGLPTGRVESVQSVVLGAEQHREPGDAASAD